VIILRTFWRLIVSFTGYVLASFAAAFVFANDLGRIFRDWLIGLQAEFGVDAASIPLQDDILRYLPQVLGWPVVFVVAFVPMALGITLSELFRWRSWLYHLALGGLSGLYVAYRHPIGEARADVAQFAPQELTYYLAAGFAAGLVYWLVAGRSAGLTKGDPTVPAIRQGHASNVPQSDSKTGRDEDR
jgi:membrane protease YdiL (CAAX protease family)